MKKVVDVIKSFHLNFNFNWSIFKEKYLLEKDELIFRIVQILLAEYFGTAMLVFWGCNSLGLLNDGDQAMDSWMFGIAIFLSIHVFGPISNCHINPAVTVTFFIYGYVSLVMSLLYIVAQVLGGITGYGLLLLVAIPELTSYGFKKDDNFCVTMISDDISVGRGLLLEILSTGILCLMVCRACNPINQKVLENISIQYMFIIFILVYSVGPFTGASLNPARSFGPALWKGQFKHHWVYWLGPFLGAVAASFMYHIFFLPKVYYLKPEEAN